MIPLTLQCSLNKDEDHSKYYTIIRFISTLNSCASMSSEIVPEITEEEEEFGYLHPSIRRQIQQWCENGTDTWRYMRRRICHPLFIHALQN